ncbi:NUDIX hydrolase [Methanospirillum stamsii]|uniref:NUDIX hydrolase n=1 Tax=Methanospirillum stamsii TaxID=1277351 RepID=A0A2V2NDL7_9EURY|nr:NUDIX hydrolase [Methanospirillum stamsii]PWR75686.1 NUDIX hydrolase [Methanospirillum stamsii]
MELYRGRRLWVEKRLFQLPHGKEKEMVVVHPGDAVVILPREGDNFLLIRQWRAPINQYIFEAPAGTMEEGEDPLYTARRELIEETGMDAKTLIPRGFIYTTPGFADEKLWLFEAIDLTPSGEFSPDDDEVIEPVRFSASKIGEMILNGEIIDAKTICIFFRCLGEKFA